MLFLRIIIKECNNAFVKFKDMSENTVITLQIVYCHNTLLK